MLKEARRKDAIVTATAIAAGSCGCVIKVPVPRAPDPCRLTSEC